MCHPGTRLACTLAALALLASLAGCSQAPLTAPPAPDAPSTRVEPPPPPSLLGLDTLVTSVLNWKVVSSVLVPGGVDQTVTGDRYSLHFAKGSLAQSVTVTIQDYDPNVLDVQFGPHGTQFATPVELSIDFSNTACDPRRNYGEAREPVLWYWNESKSRWEEVPGTTDWVHLRHVVELQHFSRYVLGGKAGWKHEPRTENDD